MVESLAIMLQASGLPGKTLATMQEYMTPEEWEHFKPNIPNILDKLKKDSEDYQRLIKKHQEDTEHHIMLAKLSVYRDTTLDPEMKLNVNATLDFKLIKPRLMAIFFSKFDIYNFAMLMGFIFFAVFK